MKKRKHTSWLLILTLVLILGKCGMDNQSHHASPHDSYRTSTSYHARQSKQRGEVGQQASSQPQSNEGSQPTNVADNPNGKTPSESLCKSVLTPGVVKQLGGMSNIKWNGAGAFIINNDKNNLTVPKGNRPYAQNEVDSQGRPTEGNALLTRASLQHRNRNETHNGATSWRPAGFQQMRLSYPWTHLYDRGHLLGYALIGNIRGFNASESNPQNIATQTAWANEARTANSTGQNYYEGIVRRALDQNQIVRYQVIDIYRGNDLVPSGAEIKAKSADDSIEFNVFVPNVQPGVVINYATGFAKVA